jgi:hypothetical protein
MNERFFGEHAGTCTSTTSTIDHLGLGTYGEAQNVSGNWYIQGLGHKEIQALWD